MGSETLTNPVDTCRTLLPPGFHQLALPGSPVAGLTLNVLNTHKAIVEAAQGR